MTGRRGFTLLEVLLVITVGGMVLTMSFQLSNRVQHIGRERSERLGMTANVTTVAHALERELGAIGYDTLAGEDLRLVAANSVTYRAPRGVLVACRLGRDSLTLALARYPEYRARIPDPSRDSLLLYLPGDSTAPIDAWVPLPLFSGPAAAVCPTGEAAVVFTTLLDSATAHRAGATRAVVRFFETINARAYLSGSGWQFGVEAVSAAATVQPVAGRLNGPNGLELAAVDRFGVPWAPGQVAAGLDVAIRAVTHRELASGPGRVAGAADSLRFRLRLNNVP
ncbi:MAG: type II secretion system protein J [Gemmatimonadales bacterium]